MCRRRDQLEERDSVEKGHATGALGTEHDRSKFPRQIQSCLVTATYWGTSSTVRVTWLGVGCIQERGLVSSQWGSASLNKWNFFSQPSVPGLAKGRTVSPLILGKVFCSSESERIEKMESFGI